MTKEAENLSEAGQPRVEERLRVILIVRDVVIVWVLTFMGGFVVGIALSGLPRDARFTNAMAMSNILFGVLGFAIAGYLAPPRRWRHLAFVAVGVWIMSFINVIFFGVSIPQWFRGAMVLAIMMGLGGALSYIFRRPIKPTMAG